MSSASAPTLLVTGASGHLGRQALEALLPTHAGRLVAATRTPHKLQDLQARGVKVVSADFDRPDTLPAAMAGVARMLLISTDALDRPGHRVEQHKAAIAAAQTAGVRHVVYTSLVRPDADSPVALAPDHRLTEQALAATAMGFTVLRSNLYAELLLGTLPRAVQGGALVAATGAGGAAYVTREDCARTAAAALAADFNGRRTLDVTGPEALTGHDLAALASELTGKRVTFQPVPLQAMVDGMVAAGLPPPVAAAYASFDEGVARGFLKDVSTVVKDLTGQPPQPVREFLRAHRAALTG